MGLDMYLQKELYLWGYKTKIDTLTIVGAYQNNQHIQKEIPLQRLDKLTFEVAYWRKANHIHKWFVDNVQDGHDDCDRYTVSKDKLKQLLAVCKEVIAVYNNDKLSETDKIEKYNQLLPTTSGFFFGTDEYGEWYIDATNDTIEILEEEMSSDNFEDCDISYVYMSSW